MTEQRRAPVKTDAEPAPEAYNAGDPGSVGRRQGFAQLREKERLQGLAQIMQSREGRAWMYEHLAMCGAFRSSFTGNSETFFREGERNVSLRITADLMAHHEEGYVLMMQEAKASNKAVISPRASKPDRAANEADESAA